MADKCFFGAFDAPPCDKRTQAHIRSLFRESQGSTEADIKARNRRIENARRFAAWSEGAGMSLSATGGRP